MNKALTWQMVTKELESNPNIVDLLALLLKTTPEKFKLLVEDGAVPGCAISSCDSIFGRKSLYLLIFDGPIRSNNPNLTTAEIFRKMAENGGNWTGKNGPVENSIEFRLSTYRWGHLDWIKWDAFLSFLEINYPFTRKGTLPERD